MSSPERTVRVCRCAVGLESATTGDAGFHLAIIDDPYEFSFRADWLKTLKSGKNGKLGISEPKESSLCQ